MGLTLHLAPVQHWSQRTPWDRDRTLWGAWVIEAPADAPAVRRRFRLSQDIADIGKRFSSSTRGLPIGAYEPRWFMSIMHANPEEAVRAHRDLNARYSSACTGEHFA